MGTGKPDINQGPRQDFIKDRFRRYYSKTNVTAPGKLENREFGVITERGGMWRHLGFASAAELQNFLVKHAPQHAYHSSTYYTKPNARTMDEKGWLGADLIFDLDADHIKGTEKMNMEQMLAAVKVQFEKLVNDFLLDDFGFDESDVKIIFSGGRGYHAHVTSEKVLGLNSHERREIVDYITKPTMSMELLLDKKIFDTKSYQGHDTKKYIIRLYPADTPGWRGKLTKNILRFLDNTENLSREELIDMFTGYSGIGEKTARQIYESMYLGNPGNRGIDKIRRDLNLEPFSEDSVRTAFINHIVKEMTVDLGGETDEPVTTDIKRLIRLPGSLHGKSSLVVRKMSVAELSGFEPLRDSVWSGFDGKPVKVIGTADHEVKLQGEVFIVTKDAETELPEHAALMFLCQKKCDIRI